MKGSNKKHNKEIDLITYIVLFILLVLYAFYIKGTCEELGCLAIILPIIGIFVISGIEFIICLFVAANSNWKVSNSRAVVITISGLISLFVIYSLIRGYLN